MSGSEIERENLIDTIAMWLDDEIELVLIDGDSNIGKTTLLSQFARKFPKQTFSLFMRPSSRWSFDPEILRFDLANQLEWVLSGKELPQDSTVDAGDLRKQFLRLQSKARLQTGRYYFVLDGLAAIPEDEAQIRKNIVELLPLGLPPFRFLISGESAKLPELRLTEIQNRSFSIPVFGIPDTTKYLADVVGDADQREQLHRIAKGIPGRLASIRRLLKGGTSVEALLKSVLSKLPQFFDLEWAPVDLSAPDESRVLSILCHDEREHTPKELARFAECTEERISAILRKLSFLTTDSNSGSIRFVHQSFRDFAAQQLAGTKAATIDRLISGAAAEPNDPASLAHLPRLYKERARYGDLVEYLSPERIALIGSHAQSWGPLLSQTRLALGAASEIGRFESVVRFSLNCATIQDIDTSGPLRSEIAAHLALGENEIALSLATRPTLREDRLQMLILIARSKRREGLAPAPELLDNIRSLFKDIDIVSTDKALAMAADLVNVAPDLAIQLLQKVEKSVDKNKSGDWNEKSESQATPVSAQPESVTAKSARQSVVKQMTMEIAYGMRETPADQLLQGSEKIVLPQDRLLLYRQWIVQNRMKTDALSVTQKALDLIVRVPELSANASTACDIAASLPFSADQSAAKHVIAQLDAQSGIFKRLGPSEDYVQFQLLMAEAQSHWDLEASSGRIVDIYFFVCDIKDIAIRTNCLAHLVAAVPRIDRDGRLAKKEELPQEIQKEFDNSVNLLLAATGDHGVILARNANVLAYADANSALVLAKKLNTIGRRDTALLGAVRGVLARKRSEISTEDLTRLVVEIKGNETLSRALILIFEQLNGSSTENIIGSEKLPVIIALCHKIDDAEDRIRAQANALAVLCNLNIKPDSLRDSLIQNIKSGWGALNTSWRKRYAGFSLAQLLARPYPTIAREFLDKTRDYGKTVLTTSPTVTWDLSHSIRLAIRAHRGLLERRIDNPDDIRTIAALVERVPSIAEQAYLYADLALRLYRGNRSTEADEVVFHRLKPVIATLSVEDRAYQHDVVAGCAAALYMAHRTTALEMISALPALARDQSLLNICTFLEFRVSSAESIEGDSQRFVTYEDLTDICDLVRDMTEDALIYSRILKMSESIARNRAKYTRPQIQEIKRRILEIITTKFPSPDYIAHDGFRICGQAAMANIEALSTAQWNVLIKDAELIPNTTDQCFVFAVIASSLPERELALRDGVITRFFAEVPTIPALTEQIRLYEWAATRFVGVNKSYAQKCVRTAVSLFAQSEEKDQKILRDLVDISQQMGDEFSEEISALCEADPAKTMARQAQNRIRLIEQCKVLTDPSKKTDGVDMESISQAAWKALGELNSKRANAVPVNHIIGFVKDAAEVSLSESYAVYSWAIENAVVRLSQSDQAQTTLRPLFQTCIASAKLICQLVSPSGTLLTPSSQKELSVASIVISDGEREKAMQFIEKWLSATAHAWLVICDPFFGPNELEIVKLVRKSGCNSKITVLTSRKHQTQNQLIQPWESEYRKGWNRISSIDAGHCDIIVAGGKSTGELPVHARWILAPESGLGLDSSLNGIGLGKSTELRVLTKEEASLRLSEIQPLIDRIPTIRDGERLEYSVFSL